MSVRLAALAILATLTASAAVAGLASSHPEPNCAPHGAPLWISLGDGSCEGPYTWLCHADSGLGVDVLLNADPKSPRVVIELHNDCPPRNA